MKKQQCPICGDELQLRDVAPCHECGHLDVEIDDLREGKHTYHEFEIFGERTVLCDFCMVDFGSHYPSFFGPDCPWPIGLGTRDFRELRTLHDAGLERGMVCESCNARLKYLKWLLAVREKFGYSE